MKKETIFQPSILPVFTLIAGVIGFILRFILLRTQVDAQGLLAANHPLSILLYVLTACTLAVLALCVLPLKADPRRYRRMFRMSIRPAFGCMFAGIGVLLSGLQQILRQRDLLTMITILMAFVAVLCFAFLGYARQKGTRPHYLVHTGIVVYLMLHLVCQYRVWSPEPQLSLYFFQLLACVFLMLTAYQAVCLDIHKGDRRLYVFFNQAALFFCCLSLTDSLRYFYLGMGIYCATNLCTLRVSRSYYKDEAKASKPVPIEQEETVEAPETTGEA